MAKNILIRDLTDEQNKRLEQLQNKFGVKTNSQALLLLLQYCVITDDEVTNLMESYSMLGLLAFEAMKKLEESGQADYATQIKDIVGSSIRTAKKLEYLLNMRK